MASDHPMGCECEDLNGLVREDASPENTPAGLTQATAGRLRRLYDIEAAALATAAVLLGRPAPDVLATARVSVARDLRAMATHHVDALGGEHRTPRARPLRGLREQTATPRGLCALCDRSAPTER
jgi:hypothetical protein